MLEPSIAQHLRERYQQMNAEGKLFSQTQLDGFYSTFRARFGPDTLSNLDGEALLEAMYNHGNRDSLVYWLEFKSDDEFPSIRFGGIGGGSALKFGIFRRNETNEWQAADQHNHPKPISVQEAISIARRNRDQLLKGVEILGQLPANGTDDDYKAIQEQLDARVPDVSNLAWSHKYFSLLFPTKLEDYHTEGVQRFHLLKLLQRPPDGPGRYLCAGRYVAAANELGVPMNNFSKVLNAVHGSRHLYWRIGASDQTASRNCWDIMRDGNCVAIGWPDLGDLSSLEASKEAREEFQRLFNEKYPNTAKSGEVIRFCTGIATGDLVLAADGGTVLGVGRVTGDYLYEPTSDFPHRRPVEWLTLDEWKMPEPEALRTTVKEMKQQENILEVERRIANAAPQPQNVKTPISRRSDVSHQPRLTGIPGRIQSVLDRKSQVILYGPPGTGKTFWAESTALDLAAYWTFGKPFDQLEGSEKALIEGDSQNGGLVRACTFHPAYGYEDFIEGYRPETLRGQIAFRVRDGVFKRLCKDAANASDRKFFLIVDEINRGDIPRILGELMTVLEKDKRGKTIQLPVSGEPFRVPGNIFLIGTMNTADRSISLLDTALRRRFGFVELMPDSSTLGNHAVSGVPLGPWLDALNRRVCEYVGRDARDLQIGHAYLLQGGRPLKDFAAFKKVLRDDIVPLLEEYCYDDFAALQNILGPGLVGMSHRVLN
jgi:5-methylcytosine-specific restriction protein B